MSIISWDPILYQNPNLKMHIYQINGITLKYNCFVTGNKFQLGPDFFLLFRPRNLKQNQISKTR